MIPKTAGEVEESEYLSMAGHAFHPYRSMADDSSNIELSFRVRQDLLDFDSWGEILTTYGRTMRVAVALTDERGRMLGKCRNAQPVWTLVHDASSFWGTGCPFCITTHQPCTAIAEALDRGVPVMARDQAGLTHVAVPLLLGKHRLGAIIAGQVFDRYPEPLPLRRVAAEFGLSAQQLWDVARRERPVGSTALQSSGELLRVLGHAFLQQRFGAILEARLAETNARFRLLVEGVKDYALFTMDVNGRVTSWNGGAERMLGYLEDEIVGQNFSCMFGPEDIQERVPQNQLHKALQAGRSVDEGWRSGRDGKLFWTNVNITALLEDAGPVRGFAIIMQDVTDRKKIAIALEEARQESARLQGKFLSHVSHELRTPLTAIYFFTTNLLDGLLGDMTPHQREHMAFALDNVKQLKEMVSDLLDITRIETHKLSVERQHTNLTRLIGEALSTCRRNAEVKNISLSFDHASSLPFVWADPARVRQILINLVDNGIKFTPGGGSVTVHSSRSEGDDRCLLVSVSDTGCGIDPNNLEMVFDRLVQIEGSAEVSRRGLGLGLFIARELVSGHGCRIWVESQLGHGSTFYFTLPVFSLAKLCVPVFTTSNLKAGFVTLIAVDVSAIEGGDQTDILTEIRSVLVRCIHGGQDMLLPPMGDTEPALTFFIVACTDPNGFKVIANRILRELQAFDNVSQLQPIISSTSLPVSSDQSREEQIGAVTTQLDQLVQAHLITKERLR
jgi:PAS domain S-box-containing protein